MNLIELYNLSFRILNRVWCISLVIFRVNWLLNRGDFLLRTICDRILLLRERESSVKAITSLWRALSFVAKDYTSSFNFLSHRVFHSLSLTYLIDICFSNRSWRGDLHLLIKSRSFNFLKLLHPIFKIALMKHLLSIAAGLA